jgi:hypothetical protein
MVLFNTLLRFSVPRCNQLLASRLSFAALVRVRQPGLPGCDAACQMDYLPLVLLVLGVGIEHLEQDHLHQDIQQQIGAAPTPSRWARLVRLSGIRMATTEAATKPTSRTFLKALDRLLPREDRKYQAMIRVEVMSRNRMGMIT